MNAQTWGWACALVASYPGLVSAQNPGQADERDTAKPVRRFFDRPVDLWRSGLNFENATGKPPEKDKAGDEWGQIVRLPDGQMAYRELPKPLVKLLDDPSPENVRAYFDWRLERTRKILLAAERVKDYRDSQAPERPGPEAQPAPSPLTQEPKPRAEKPDGAPAAGSPLTMLYFHQAGCAYCDRQDRVLGTWIQEGAPVKLEVVEGGTRPELWGKYRIRGTPSLVFLPAGGGEHLLVEGFADQERLNLALKECRKSLPAAREEKGEGP